jgi:multidrug efflux system outer membrane protein
MFDGGRLNANLQSVRTASNILIKQYNQAVLDAVRDVAIGSSELNDLNQQVVLQKLKVTAAMATSRSASAHYQRGLVSYYAAQEARRPVIAQQLLLLDIQAQRLSSDITLIKALGGITAARRRRIWGNRRAEAPLARQSNNCHSRARFTA